MGTQTLPDQAMVEHPSPPTAELSTQYLLLQINISTQYLLLQTHMFTQYLLGRQIYVHTVPIGQTYICQKVATVRQSSV